ncbi:MAG: acyl-CoA dehydrogenase family protein, partial [Gammaproteobacteria bacterium]
MSSRKQPQHLARKLFDSDHELFRDNVRRFFETEVMPHHERWEEQGYVDRDCWKKAGDNGLLCVTMPEQYGGAGVDRLYSTILIEEAARLGASGPGFSLHSDIVSNYLLNFGSEEIKQAYLPAMARGEKIGAIAMTEPGTGSDLKNIRTTAVRHGDEYVINGSKTFISNGLNCDLVIVVAKTDPTQTGSKAMSLILVEADRPGFRRGRKLDKVGQHAADTAELFFDDVRVPASNVLGGEGK